MIPVRNLRGSSLSQRLNCLFDFPLTLPSKSESIDLQSCLLANNMFYSETSLTHSLNEYRDFDVSVRMSSVNKLLSVYQNIWTLNNNQYALYAWSARSINANIPMEISKLIMMELSIP